MQTLMPPSGRIYDAVRLKIYTMLELMAVNVRAKFQLFSFYLLFLMFHNRKN